MRPKVILFWLGLILASLALFWLGSSRDDPSMVTSAWCERCAAQSEELQRKDGEIAILQRRLNASAAALDAELHAAPRAVMQPVSADSERRIAELMQKLSEALTENAKLASANEHAMKQLMALLYERADSVVQRYLQGNVAGTQAHLDRMREYLALAYRVGLNPDLQQVEKLHRAVEEIVPRMERNPTAVPEGYDPGRFDWQVPQFSLIDWRHEQQVKLAASLQERVAEALAAPTTLLFPEDE